MIDNFICQTVASSGSDALINLANALNGFGKFKDAFSASGVVYYTLIDGNNKETGLANFDVLNETLERIKVFTVVSGGTYRKDPVTYMSYSNTAIVACMNSVEALLATRVSWVKEPLQLQAFTSMGSTVKGFIAPTLTREQDYLTGQYFLSNKALKGGEVFLELLIKSESALRNQVNLITDYIYVNDGSAIPDVSRENTLYTFQNVLDNAAETVKIPLGLVPDNESSLVINLTRDFSNGLDTVESRLVVLGARICYQIDKLSTLSEV